MLIKQYKLAREYSVKRPPIKTLNNTSLFVCEEEPVYDIVYYVVEDVC